jgi:hypothetical protein
MTVQADDTLWVDIPQEVPEPAVEPNMGLLDALPALPPGYYRKWCPKRGGWVTTKGEEEDDQSSQANLTKERYCEWWEDALADAIKDLWRTPGAM